VEVHHTGDLDRDGLDQFADGRFDFVIANHVVEHVANPIRFVAAVFRITRPGGRVVLSAPDKTATFDRDRPLTPFEHLDDDYRRGVTEIERAHHVEFLRAAHPEVLRQGEAAVDAVIESMKNRRDHVHVWDSDAFDAFLRRTLEETLALPARCLYASTAAENGGEHFSVWEKSGA
jgi:SAM-dependent methyltransferase